LDALISGVFGRARESKGAGIGGLSRMAVGGWPDGQK
jgi:hypothetical protein